MAGKKNTKNEDDKKKTNPKPGRPLIPMPRALTPEELAKENKKLGNPQKGYYIPGFEDMGPVKWAEPENARKDLLSGLTHEYGTKSLLKAMLKFRK